MATHPRSLLGFFLLLLPQTSFADDALTKVFYVGGYRASAAQMRCWEQGARRNSDGGYEFQGVPYPSGARSSYQAAVNGASGTIKRIVAEINANPNKKYVIAGHSSGAAIANTIAKRAKNPGRIKQVILDGFASPRIPGAQCWVAKGRGGKRSRNYGILGACGSGNGHVYQDNHCSAASQWCLHFSLVVKSTPAKLSNFVANGYQGCDTNLDWLR